MSDCAGQRQHFRCPSGSITPAPEAPAFRAPTRDRGQVEVAQEDGMQAVVETACCSRLSHLCEEKDPSSDGQHRANDRCADPTTRLR